MRILLLGTTGQIGGELTRTLPPLGPLVTASRSGSTDYVADLQKLKKLQDMLDAVSPEIIINASAYTAVDKAESEPKLAMRLNTDVPDTIGKWAATHGALVVHYSTDYVYDGTCTRPYLETDETNPVSIYGHTKLAGDEALLSSGCAALVLRVSWIYGLTGHNFLLTMQRLMQEREELSIIDDQTGAPTWSRSIAKATAILLSRVPTDVEKRLSLKGVYHLAPQGQTTWFGFASAIQEKLGLSCRLLPIATAEYPTPAKRPMRSWMDSTKIKETFGIALPKWDEELGHCLNSQHSYTST